MGEQVLGGGVIVLVAVLLWMVYLLPTWHSRHLYNASERNAVRLNQALRVLAETSEMPQEVRLELNARTAMAQQRLAKRTQAELSHAELEQARHDLAVARSRPAARRARARRRARLITLIVGLTAVGLAVWGGWQVVTTGSQVLLWSAVGLAVLCGLLLHRMSQVGARAVVQVADAAPAKREAAVQDLSLAKERAAWTPRELPRPLVSSAGSRASAMLNGEDARAALRRAALEESLREREVAQRPPSLVEARRVREATDTAGFARMGYVDDAEIEAHVRQLLERRAASA